MKEIEFMFIKYYEFCSCEFIYPSAWENTYPGSLCGVLCQVLWELSVVSDNLCAQGYSNWKKHHKRGGTRVGY